MIYKKALKHDGLKHRLLVLAEECSELAAAILRNENRPDRDDNMQSICLEYMHVQMCMKTVEEALPFTADMRLKETIRFDEKLKQRMMCPCKRGKN